MGYHPHDEYEHIGGFFEPEQEPDIATCNCCQDKVFAHTLQTFHGFTFCEVCRGNDYHNDEQMLGWLREDNPQKTA